MSENRTEKPLVLHVAPVLGNLTDRWIDTQARGDGRFDSRLAGFDLSPDWPGEAPPHWQLHDGSLTRLGHRVGGIGALPAVRELRRAKPSLLHFHYGDVAARSHLIPRRLGVPWAVSFYGYDACETRFSESRFWRRRYARLFARAGAFVVEGPRMAERLRLLGCPEPKIEIVRLPADAAGLAGCEREPDPGFSVSIAGRFAEKKGFDTAIVAFARALRGEPGATLKIVGGGELEPLYRRLVLECGIAGQVEFRGRLAFGDFMRTIASSRLGLYSSRVAPSGDSEGGAPVTLIEAQWLGVPSLVSDHDDLPFVAAPSGSRVLPATDIDAWAAELRRLYQSPDEVARMSGASRTFARAHHSPEANLAGRERVYASLLGLARAPARARREEAIPKGEEIYA